MQLELTVMHWVICDLKFQKVEFAQHQLITKWKWYIPSQTTAGSEGKIKLHEVFV